MKISVKMIGTDKLQKELAKLGEQAPRALGAALYQEGEEILGDSQDNYVPVDEGTLRGSGRVTEPTDGPNPEVTIGFGGPAADYALVVHEDLNAHHPVGQAKYLERPFLKAIPGMGERLAKRVKGQI